MRDRDLWNETGIGWVGPKPGEPADPRFIQAARAMHFPGVAILSGLPGAGKSYMTAVIRTIHSAHSVAVVSSDHFWRPDYSDFDPAKLPLAHQACFRAFLHAAMLKRAPMIVVDNTNIGSAEVAPYYLAGQALGYQVKLLRINVDPVLGVKRNTHGVDAELMDRMHAGWVRRDVMPWWDVVEIEAR